MTAALIRYFLPGPPTTMYMMGGFNVTPEAAGAGQDGVDHLVQFLQVDEVLCVDSPGRRAPQVAARRYAWLLYTSAAACVLTTRVAECARDLNTKTSVTSLTSSGDGDGREF